MKFKLIIEGADFSSFGLGQSSDVSTYINNFNALGGGTLTTNEKTALQSYYDGLVSANLWDKIEVLYPFIGSTATYHKYNFKNYQDTDAAYRLTFSNDVTSAHTASGYVGDRNAQRSANSNYYWTGTLSSTCAGFYNTTGEVADTNSRVVMGGASTSSASTSISRLVLARNFSNVTQGELARTTGGLTSGTTLDRAKIGFLAVSNNSGTVKLWDDTSIVGTASATIPLTGGNVPVYLLAYKNSTIELNYFSDVTLGTAFIAKGFTDSDMVNFSNLTKAYNQSLGR
ncbi:hypothetical protein LJ707_13310 [Mucilaginibacter sp. UR6-1]|uniref:hypothetical protein n=1 Tax=Mucilaginibacter sp. UR6-1 TaxID=1435643 RepID=UPI001E4C45BF|nr:hypothetical protein [Mucilaginibacter sp. UR6-1]MCC8409910.1 hypothetical protein [Mucilaginibacter sp. UR6-1]